MVAITIIQLCKKMCIAFIEERWHHCGGSSVISTTVFGSENSSGLNPSPVSTACAREAFGVRAVEMNSHWHLHFSLINGLGIKDDDPFNSRL